MANDSDSAKAAKAAAKAAEKQANAEQQQRFHLLQQKQKLIQIVEQRLTTLRYIQNAHSKSSSFWLSSVLVTSSDIARYSLAEIPSSKCVSYYHLSISLDKLLERFAYETNYNNHAHTKLQSFTQLFEEWEYYGGGAAMQSMRLVMAKHATSIHPTTPPQQPQISHILNPTSRGSDSTTNKEDYKSSERTNATEAANTQESSVRTNLFKFNGNVVFEHLLTPCVAIDLCYSDVVVGLCESLQGMYSLFSYQEKDYWRKNALFDSFLKLDKRIKEFYVATCLKELTAISCRTSEEAFELIRSGIP